MTEQVNVDLVANDKGSPAWKRQMEAVADYNRELAKIEVEQRKSARAAQETDRAFSNMRANLVATATSYVGLQAMAQNYIAAMKEQIRLQEEAADKDDERTRKLMVQAGLNAVQGDEARKRVYAVGERLAFTGDQSFEAATQLISSGFSTTEGTGGSLRSFLEVMAASNQTGQNVDAAALAKALAAYIDSQGLDKNAANVRDVGQSVQRLFKGTNLQLTDLPFLANEGTVFKGKMTTEEQLASFAALVDSKTSGATAAVGLREFVGRLSGASADKSRMDALKAMGLKPEQTDFVGESMGQVLDTLAAGLESVKPEKRSAVMQKLFGTATESFATSLIDKRDVIQKNIGITRDRAGFESDVSIATSGRNAAARRLALKAEVANSETGVQYTNTWNAFNEVMREKGHSDFTRFLRGLQYFSLAHIVNPETAVGMIAPTGDDFGGTRAYQGAVRDKLAQATDPQAFLAEEMKRLREINQRQLNLMERPTKFTPRTDTRPPGPRPSAALGGGS